MGKAIIPKGKRKKLKEMEKEINKEIFFIAESILETENAKIKGRMKGIIHKYIIKRIEKEEGFENYRLDLKVCVEIKTEVKEALLNLNI